MVVMGVCAVVMMVVVMVDGSEGGVAEGGAMVMVVSYCHGGVGDDSAGSGVISGVDKVV